MLCLPSTDADATRCCQTGRLAAPFKLLQCQAHRPGVMQCLPPGYLLIFQPQHAPQLQASGAADAFTSPAEDQRHPSPIACSL